MEIRRGIEHRAVQVDDGGADVIKQREHSRRFIRLARLAAHRIDHGLVVGLAENGRAGDKGIGAGFGGSGDIVDLDAAVDFEQIS